MITYEIETVETVPTLKKYVYIVDAENKKDAESKFKEGIYKDVSHVKDIEILAASEIEIKNISEVA